MPSDVDSVQAAYPVSTFWTENLQCVCSHALYCTMHTWELSDLMFTGFGWIKGSCTRARNCHTFSRVLKCCLLGKPDYAIIKRYLHYTSKKKKKE